MPLQNFKIKTGLLLAFGAIVLLVMALGGVTLVQTGSMWRQTDYLYKHPFVVNIAVREIQTNIMAMSRSMKDVVLSESKAETDAHVHKIDALEREVFKLFDIVYAQYLGKKADVDTAYRAFRDWKPIRGETIELRRQGKIAEAARRSTKGAGSESVEQIIDNVSKLSDFALQKAALLYDSAERDKNTLYNRLAVILIVIIALIIFVFYTIMRMVTAPLKVLTRAADKYRHGQYDAASPLTLTNEFGQLAGAFHEMAQAVQSDMAIKSGVNAIADAMIGKDQLAVFAGELLAALLSKTGSNIGAIYLLNEEKALFEHYCSIGLSQEKIRSFSANVHEGEFGAVLSGKRSQRIKLIPEDTIFDFSVVAGTFKPKEIITIPILRQDKVIAVLSLAALQEYSSSIMEMLAFAEKNITTGINSMLAFEDARELAHRLSAQNDRLEEQSRELRIQTEELQAQNAEIGMQKRQIEEANRLKSEFLSNMSHELRTPLNAVIALSGVLHRRLQGQIPDEEYSYLEIIERNGKDLLALINDILDLSRIEAGKAQTEYDTFSMGDIVQSILTTLQSQIWDKHIEVKNSIDPQMPMITSDRSKCHHILQNIIGNAIKFTDKGSVEVTARQVERELSIVVRDTGIGIPADQLSSIFEAFRQADGTASRKHEGTGLGLAIAAQYSALLNGRIEVESKPGEGSIFTLILPVVPSEGREPATAFGRRMAAPSGGSMPVYNAAGTGKTILIIEDSEPAVIQVSEILKEAGYVVEIARSGPEALAAVRSSIPDGIILDLMMPGMDGFEVLERIRGTQDTARIPVLILTAKYVSKSELARLTENNVHQLIQKGDIGKSDLLAEVHRMLFPAAAVPTVKEGKATVLLIDDNPDNATTVKALLGERHDVIAAIDGYMGVAKAKAVRPDVILLDISMPRMDGFAVFDEIRKEKTLRDVPVVALTARAMKGDREQILRYGFDGYISKPIDSEHFEKTLQKWLKVD